MVATSARGITAGLLALVMVACAPQSPSLTDNWSVYRDEEFGFTFQYPNNWKIISGRTEADVIVLQQPVELSSLPNNLEPYANLRVSVWPTPSEHPAAVAAGVPASTTADLLAGVRQFAPKGETAIDGVPAVRYLYNDGHQHFGLFIERNNLFYALQFERTWTAARFDAARVEPAVLASWRWTN